MKNASALIAYLKDEEGRKYERDTWASTIMDSFPEDLTSVPVTKLMPRAGLAALPEATLIPLRDRYTLRLNKWTVAGPFPSAKGGNGAAPEMQNRRWLRSYCSASGKLFSTAYTVGTALNVVALYFASAGRNPLGTNPSIRITLAPA